MDRPTVILIAGPTASGKSALALSVAEQLGGVVVNANSMQVYRDLRVITARPSPDEEARAPHRLYGHVDAAINYSTGQWLRDVDEVMRELKSQNRIPVLVGGTGLYFKALTSGLAAVPPIPAEIRERVRARVREEGTSALHAELMTLDPPTAHRIDAQRPLAHFPCAGSGAGDRPLADRLAPRRSAAAGRCRPCGEGLCHLRA